MKDNRYEMDLECARLESLAIPTWMIAESMEMCDSQADLWKAGKNTLGGMFAKLIKRCF